MVFLQIRFSVDHSYAFNKNVALDDVDFGTEPTPAPDTFTVSYSWVAGPEAVQEKVTLPATATLEDGAQYTVDQYDDVELTSGDTEVSGDWGTWEISTSPEAGTYNISGEDVVVEVTATKA